MRPRPLVVVLLAALCSLVSIDTARADRPPKEERERSRQLKKQRQAELKQARAFRKLRVPGEQVASRVEKLTTELVWHDSLEGALATAREQNRPVLWIQALGELKGYL